jgi:transcriptional regulator with XRE-family HTH domain
VPKSEFINVVGSHVADLLKEERERQGFSLKALSQKAGLARQTITFIENEVQSPTLDTLLRLTLALDIDLTKIILKAYKRGRKECSATPQKAKQRSYAE